MAPSKVLLSIELIRAVYEYGMGWLLNIPLQFISPKGDSHPVIIIPGLGTSDGSTHFIRNFLTNLGYDTHSWGLGRNLGPQHGMDELLDKLVRRTNEVSEMSDGQEVSIIGWSLGGIYAREIAKEIPDVVRQVITLGTPFKGADQTNAALLYELLSKDTSHKDPNILKRIAEPPPVPFTSIFSKTDGVVYWESSIEKAGKQIENIEVPGACHLGLGHNPISMFIIANRLAQQKDTWVPYSS
jgi:pimeloyl-ACP methyl ester carboxylesterase